MVSQKKERDRLRARWSRADLVDANRLLAGGTISTEGPWSVQATSEAWIDLRGITITDVIRNVELSRLDFSHGRIADAGQFGLCSLQQCRFSSGDFGTNLGRKLVACEFIGASLRRAALFGELLDCDFSGADLSQAKAHATFGGCSFRGAKLKGAHFLNCVFDQCDFSDCNFGGGSLAFSRITQRSMIGVDFKDTLMEGVIVS